MNNIYIDFTEEEIANFYRTIGKNVKRLRTENGLTQMDLGIALGHSGIGTISVAEVYYNKKHFNLEHLYKISKILDCKMDEFFKECD